jgi:hypothetical protein
MMNGNMGGWYSGFGYGNLMFGVLIGAAAIIVVAVVVKYLSKSK